VPTELPGVRVRHNFETAHRLTATPGKCENIHGHSFWCEIELRAPKDPDTGIVVGDYGEIKAAFRGFLDTRFDHRILLNQNDIWSTDNVGTEGEYRDLPGVQTMVGDPTTENIAEMIGDWIRAYFGDRVHEVHVMLWETSVNCATWRWKRG
jgi:6-pyruvoyltetrahydropterin/6-carboxytetrahydropterin synthase